MVGKFWLAIENVLTNSVCNTNTLGAYTVRHSRDCGISCSFSIAETEISRRKCGAFVR